MAINSVANQGSASGASSQATDTSGIKKSNSFLGKDDFLKLLIAELKNQDPESAADTKDFTNQLTSLGQLEQLIQMNKSLLDQQTQGVGSLSGYLGNRIYASADSVTVEGGNAGELAIEMGSSTSDLRVDFLDAAGQVKYTANLGAFEAGKHPVDLSNLPLRDGTFSLKVRGVASDGSEVQGSAYITGIVSGFVPGATPMLLVGDREIAPDTVKQVVNESTSTPAV